MFVYLIFVLLFLFVCSFFLSATAEDYVSFSRSTSSSQQNFLLFRHLNFLSSA